MKLCVYGAASNDIHQDYLWAAEMLGITLAKKGIGLVFGAGDTGVMGACARGCAAMGGEIIGVAPRFFDEPGILFQGCTQMHFTETMRQRKELMEQLSDGFLMAPGGIGTFEEFFEILTLRQLGRHQKPIAILNVRGYYDPLLALMENAAAEHFLGSDVLKMFTVFSDPAKLPYALEKLR